MDLYEKEMKRWEKKQQARHNKHRFNVILVRSVMAIGVACAVFLMGCGCLYLKEKIVDYGKVAQAGNVSNDLPQDELLAQNPGSSGESDVVPGSSESTPESSEVPGSSETDPTQSSEVVLPEDEYIVVLDAGHGGNDGGTFSGDIIEKNITLDVVMYMNDLLKEKDITVVLTRDHDDYVSLEERVEVEHDTNPDLFVSIHCNSFEGDESVNGLECYYLEDSEVGKQVAETFVEILDEETDIRIRGAKEDTFFVLKYTDCPAVLIEMGFLSNPTECKNLSTPEYQEDLAEVLVDCILETLALDLED